MNIDPAGGTSVGARLIRSAHGSPWGSHGPRAGFTIVEAIGACLLLGILLSMTVPMLLLVARERRATEQRQVALQHIANLLEETVARDWNEIPAGELKLPDASPELVSILPGLERTLSATQSSEAPNQKQVTATIRWQNQAGQLVTPIQLSAWKFPATEVAQ